MARYSDSTKKTKPAEAPKPAPATNTYQTATPAPDGSSTASKPSPPAGYGQRGAPNALVAEDFGGSCSLTVVVFDEVSKAPLAKAWVTLRGANFQQPLPTDSQGHASWVSLPSGEYEVEVAHYHGYQREPRQEPVALTEDEDAVLHIGLAPEQSTLLVRAVYDTKRCGNPEDQVPIQGLGFGVFDGSRLLGSGKTGDDGSACVSFHHTGWVEVRPHGQVRYNGTLLNPETSERTLVALTPVHPSEAVLTYFLSTAGLSVEAVLSAGDCDGEAVPLPGVGVALYQPGASVPTRQAVTGDRGHLFSNLAPGRYILQIAPPPSFQGSPVELDDPTQNGASVVVGSAYPAQPLQLRFRKAACTLVGSVLPEGASFGWEGIGLALQSADGKTSLRVATGPQGGYLFPDVAPGVHYLELTDAKIFHDQDEWVLAAGSEQRQRIHALPGSRITAQPFFLTRDKHTLTVLAIDEDGHPIPHTAFEVLGENGTRIGRFSTGKDGKRTIDVQRAGHYQVLWEDMNRYLFETDVNSEALIEMRARGGLAARRSGSDNSVYPEATIDIPYPLITESPSMGGTSWAPSSTSPGSADLGQTVQDALRSVLNWRPAGFNGDAKGFVAALNQSFTLTQVEGHTEFSWTPRSYAAVQSGLGALTGAQASIYTRAKVALDQILPLLEGLYPLLADADPQNVEAMRAIVRSGVNELVNEFGLEGGPRVPRVDDLFRQLTGYGNGPAFNPNPEKVKGQLDQLASVFGLRRRLVNTIDEEQNLTNFLIITDYILGLQQSWITQRPFFTRGGTQEPFLGTQLVLVERALAVVSESVQEVYMAMDSVFVGPEERQVVELTFPPFENDGPSSLFVSELLGWIDQVASGEGPQLLKDGGKQGVISFQPTVKRLAFLARNALLPSQKAPNLPKGYRTARVQNALAELADHLNETANLIDQFPVSDSLGR